MLFRKTIIKLWAITLILTVTLGTNLAFASTVDSKAATKQYIITSVNDNLNNDDMYIFGNKLENIGYVKALENRNVSSAQLKNYIQSSAVKTLYHTGHGNVGAIMTSNGALYADDVVVRAENVIIATCLTLKDRKWMYRFSSTAGSVLGYTNNSYDYIDEDVAVDMGNALANGRSYIQAWYIANAPISYLNDRWCGYVREGNYVVEYSARTGYKPKASRVSSETIDTKVNASKDLLTDERTFDDQFKSYRDNTMILLKAKQQTPVEFLGTSEEFLEKVSSSEDQAMEIAGNWLEENGYSDKNIALDYISPVNAEVEDNDSTTVGYIVRYSRQIDDLMLRSNGATDHISILVNGDKIVNVSEMWSDIQVTPKESFNENVNVMIPVNKALQNAAQEISNHLKNGEVNFVTVNPCFSNQDEKIVPAYEFIDENGMTAIVSAETGELIEAK